MGIWAAGIALALADAATGGGPVCTIAGQPALAILDVRTTGLPAEMGRVLSDALRSNLIETRCFRVQDQAQMREILAAQQINQSEVCDEECAVQNGRLLQVRYLVSGQVFASGAGAVALARLTDVESGTAVAGAQVTLASIELAELLESQRRVAEKLAGVAVRPAEAMARARSAGPAAEHGEIRVTTTPEGAQVFLDGRPVGASPVTARAGAGVMHTVRADASRYEPKEQQVMADPLAARTVHLDLDRSYTMEWWMFWGGAAVALAGTATVFTVNLRVKSMEVGSRTVYYWRNVDDARNQNLVKLGGTTAFGLGVTAALTGLTLRIAF